MSNSPCMTILASSMLIPARMLPIPAGVISQSPALGSAGAGLAAGAVEADSPGGITSLRSAAIVLSATARAATALSSAVFGASETHADARNESTSRECLTVLVTLWVRRTPHASRLLAVSRTSWLATVSYTHLRAHETPE